jgi:hypothetical protein
MNPEMTLGFFALYTAAISLLRRPPPVTESRQVWERRRGLLPHFLLNVAAPLVVGIVFITRGIVGLDGGAARPYDAVPQKHVYHHVAAAMEEGRQIRMAAAEVQVRAGWLDSPSLAWTDINLKP